MPVEWDGPPCHADCRAAEDREKLAYMPPPPRLDGQFPTDPQTGAVQPESFHIYLRAMMDMVTRCHQPLSLLCLAVDDRPGLARFRREDMGMVGRAIVRCMQQETRHYDVIGRTSESDAYGLPAFLLVCPLKTEVQSVHLAERLRAAMTAYAVEEEQEWLTLSVGVASLSLDVQTENELVARTLSALHAARQNGGGTVVRHTDILRRIQERNLAEGDDT